MATQKLTVENDSANWVEWQNQRVSYLTKYIGQWRVVIGRGKSRYMYLTDKVVHALGNPERVRVLVRGNNVGLMATKEGGYILRRVEPDAPFAFIQPNSLIKRFGLQPGAYDAHESAGIVSFDTMQPPSKL